jgi:4a-hydroxytetrahydrobiopterin dehydratase
MDDLFAMRCEACSSATRPIAPEAASELLAQLPGWRIHTGDGTPKLEREFRFRDFRRAFALAEKIAALAEQEDHHPLLQVEWGKLTVKWWTHRINGLHLNDFILAARTDQAAEK